MTARSACRTLVTGASSPLGLELVRQCLLRGDRVIATSRNPARLPRLADLRAEFGGLELVALDPADASSIADAIPIIERLTDCLDLLVIGNAEPGPHDRTVDQQRDQHFDTLSGTGLVEHYRRHAVAPLLLVRTLLPFLAMSDEARVLVVTDGRGSITGKMSGGDYASSASAAALHMLMRALSHDLAEQGITVCIGNPGEYASLLEDGSSYAIPIDETASGMLAVAQRLPPQRTGALLDWTGAERPW